MTNKRTLELEDLLKLLDNRNTGDHGRRALPGEPPVVRCSEAEDNNMAADCGGEATEGTYIQKLEPKAILTFFHLLLTIFSTK